jgi:cell wall-associated NlpC family hydrolase
MSDLYSKLLGVPYKKNGRDYDGLDCYGLIQLYYREKLGIYLPEYVTPENDNMVSQIVMEGKQLWEELEKPAPDCAVLFRVKAYYYHMGIILDDRSFLHIVQHKNVCKEKLDHLFWKNRIEGYYKWIE